MVLYLWLIFMNETNDFKTLLQSVILHWQHSAKAYSDYMGNDKKFRYAEILKEHNSAFKKLLADNIDSIPEDFQKDVSEIIEHYTIWSAKWDDLKNKLNPSPDDEFVFENNHRFPKMAAQRLEAAFHVSLAQNQLEGS
jgi:hypothetical protein